jgi:hypothetical protein
VDNFIGFVSDSWIPLFFGGPKDFGALTFLVHFLFNVHKGAEG